MCLIASSDAVNQLLRTVPSLLRNPNVHNCVHKSPVLDPLNCQINPVHGLKNFYL
jgi:hypothetical protein